jgi:NitT/TauT family transport system permease protein
VGDRLSGSGENRLTSGVGGSTVAPTFVALKLLSVALALAAWSAVSALLPPGLFPGPFRTSVVLWQNVLDGEVGHHLAMTLLRVTGGFVLAMLIGVPVGVIMGLYRRAERILDVWVMVGLTIPSLCYAIICFIWFGLNEMATVVAIGVTTAPSIAINLWEGVKDIDVKLVDMARSFEASRPRIFTRVILPQVMPYVVAASRFGLGIVWKITVLVELLGRPSGVGFRLFYWYQLADMGQVLAWTLLFTLVMLFIELVIFKGLERRLFGWRPQVRLS